ncbi:MAG: hypothetical protein N4A71_05645 [Carboxylicivirga sp.]|jgi:hypothetical protein|nr:hypothetical protein [Carboxylicivirga sp.]
MSTGRIISNSSSIKAQAPSLVVVSDGTMKFPSGHPDYFTRLQPDGMLLLDLFNNEYSEFKLNADRDCNIELYNHMEGSRYKIFVYRTKAEPINIGLDRGAQTYIIPGISEGETEKLLVLDVEVAMLNGILTNKIGPTSEKLDEIIGALNTSSIKLSEDITFNGVKQGSYKDGDKMTAGETMTTILKKFAQKANPVSYSAPSFSISPNNQTIEAGTNVNPSIIPSFVQRDAGALNRYLLQLSTGDGAPVSLLDGAALKTYNQALIQIQDGAYLEYTATAYYDEGLTKLNNMGEPDPTGKILAGSESDVLRYSGIRKAFYSADTIVGNPGSSSDIRSLAGKKDSPVNGTSFTLNIPAGTKRVVFAYPATLRNVTSVKYAELGNGEVADTFQLINFNVEGANGYKAIAYKVYVYTPAVPFNASATYNVTI